MTVAGAVVNSNAFVWKPGRTAGEYLTLAGTDEAADPSNMFILRADGTVTKAGDRRGWFSRGGLESQVMQPGDALIVPNRARLRDLGPGAGPQPEGLRRRSSRASASASRRSIR